MPHSQGLSKALLSKINPIPRIDAYFFKVHSNNDPTSTPRPLFPVDLPVQILKALTPSILATCPVHLNLLDLIILY
jgi:hypothetical protein